MNNGISFHVGMGSCNLETVSAEVIFTTGGTGTDQLHFVFANGLEVWHDGESRLEWLILYPGGPANSCEVLAG